MKRFAIVAILAVIALLPVTAMAQDNRDHIELGVFADYFRLNNPLTLPPFPSTIAAAGLSSATLNSWGLGGRFGIGVAPHVDLEADMAYDFEKNVTASSSGTGTFGASTEFARSGLRLWHGLFGPMVWFGSKHARVFVEAKGGFINTSFSGGTAASGFTSNISNFTSSNTTGSFFPGGGAEISLGPIGLRADIGDFMYFNNGAQHNLNLRFGPTIHF